MSEYAGGSPKASTLADGNGNGNGNGSPGRPVSNPDSMTLRASDRSEEVTSGEVRRRASHSRRVPDAPMEAVCWSTAREEG